MQTSTGPLSTVSVTHAIGSGQLVMAQLSAQTLDAWIVMQLGAPTFDVPPQLAALPAGMHVLVQNPSSPAAFMKQTRGSLHCALAVQCAHHPTAGCISGGLVVSASLAVDVEVPFVAGEVASVGPLPMVTVSLTPVVTSAVVGPAVVSVDVAR